MPSHSTESTTKSRHIVQGLAIHLPNELGRILAIYSKSANPSRIKENFDVFDFTLDKEDMEAIKLFDCNGRTGVDSSEPNFMRHFEGK